MKIRPKNSHPISLRSLILTLLPIAAFVLYITLTPNPARAAGGVELKLAAGELGTETIDQGGQATYTLEVENTSSSQMTLTLSIPSGSVSSTINPSSIIIDGGKKKSVTVVLVPPSNAPHGQTYDTDVTVVNSADSNGTSTLTLKTTVVEAGVLNVDVLAAATVNGAAGNTVTLAYKIKNTGSKDETFKLSASTPNNYTTSIREQGSSGTIIEIQINSGATKDIDIVVNIGNNAANGQDEVVTLTAVSKLDPRVSDSATGRVNVAPATLTPTTPSDVVYSDQYEPNGSLQNATDITSGSSNRLCHATFWPTGDMDYYRFTTQPGLQYVIETENLDSGIDPFMTLYDANGNAGVQHDNISDIDLNAQIGFIAGGTGYTYIKLENKANNTPDGSEYCVILRETLVTPTPTPSNTPEPTPTTTLTPSITPAGDKCEPNETANDACFMAIGETINGDFVPPFEQSDDKDFYKIFVRRGIEYTCTTFNLSSHADTKMEVRQAAGYVWLGDNNDRIPLNPSSGSEVVFKPGADGDVYVIITAFTRPQEGIEERYTYDVKCEGESPTATPEPTETAEPTATQDFADIGDVCEPNEIPGAACFITTGQTVGNNFAPPPGYRTDTDYFRMFARKGVLYTCTTFNLSNFTDTRMEIRQEQGFTWLGDNNDAEPFNPSSGSEVAFQSKVDGNIYIIVRPFTQPEPNLETSYTYDLRCSSEAPTVTPTPSETPLPTNTPRPVAPPPNNGGNNGGGNTKPPTPTPPPLPTQPQLPTATPFQTATPTLTPAVGVVPLPTQIPQETPPPTNVSLDVLVYYDANENFSAESTEGIVDIAVSIYDNATGDLLAFGYTNGNGIVSFTGLQPQGALRINIEFLGFSQIVPVNVGQIPVRVSPQQMPNLIP